MRVDVKGLSRDVARIPLVYHYWYTYCPEYESDYLMDHFVLPILRGEPIRVNELDLAAFTMDEIDDLHEFIDNRDCTSPVLVTCGLGDMAQSAPPVVKTGRVFC